MAIPENFNLLCEGEQRVRLQSASFIDHSEQVSCHLTLIAEALTCFSHFAMHYEDSTEALLTIRLIGIRLFNVCSSAVNQALNGYYQNSAMFQRDFLEVSFLVNYFTSNPNEITVWSRCDESERVRA